MYKSLFSVCLCVLLLLGVAFAQEGTLNDYQQNKQDSTGSFPSAELTSEDTLVCENDAFRLYYNSVDSILKVEDLQNRYVWSSGRVDETTEKMSNKWKNFAHTLISAEVVHLNSLTTKSVLPDFESIEISLTDQGIHAVIPLKGVEITVTMDILLTEKGLHVSIPDDGIQCNGTDYRLMSLMPLPFLGAAMQGEGDGYLFIPDGSGALIRFDNATSAVTEYEEPFYGTDQSMIWVLSENTVITSNATPMQEIRLPVMGIVHGEKQNAMLIHVSGGAECAYVHASAADMITDFYYTAPKFTYATIYIQPDGTGTGFSMITDEKYSVGAAVDYYFLEGDDAGWTGMARVFRDILYPSDAWEAGQTSDIPLLVNAIMAETVEKSLGEMTVVLTTDTDIENWYRSYLNTGISNVIFSLDGITQGGLSRQKAENFNIIGSVGSAESMKQLAGWIEQQGGKMLWSRDIVSAYKSQVSANMLRYGVYRKYTTVDTDEWLDSKLYFFTALESEKIAERLIEAAKDWSGVNAQASAATLLSDYKGGIEKTRRDEIEQCKTLLSQLETNSDYLLLALPNAYAADYGDGIYNVPISHSSMIFETDCVPFTQMIYSGRKDLFTTEMIPGNNDKSLLLKMIAFGVYPQYTFINEDEPMLEHSNLSQLYSAVFAQLFELSVEEYAFINSTLSEVRGQMMQDYQVPMTDVVVVTYSEGTQIVVNFRDTAVTVQGLTIEPESARVLMQKTQ